MRTVVVTAFGPDRPGIVAAVTGVLVEHGANLADTAMTKLAGQFAMVLVVELPDGEATGPLEEALAGRTADLGLTVAVRPLDPREAVASVDGSAWSVSVYGADRPGIVHRVTSVLADHDANVVDLTTRAIGTSDAPVYVMLLEVSLPLASEVAPLRAALDALAGDLGVEVHVRPDDADVL